MPPDLPKYVKRIPGRHGQAYLYFRHGKTYLRLPDDPASAAFHAEYARLLSGNAKPSAKLLPPDSVLALIADYKRAPEYLALAPKTQRDYARQLDHLGAAVGPFPAKALRRSDIVKLRNKLASAGAKRAPEAPGKSGGRTADLFVAVVSRCYGIGLDLGYAETNPAADIARLAETESYTPWPIEARRTFESSAPPAHLLDGYMLALWTGLRISDVLRIGRQHDDGVALTIRPRKTRKSSGVEVYVPVYWRLRQHLEVRGGRDRLLYVTRDNGRPVSAEQFSKDMRAWLDARGMTGLRVHGLRHTTGTALAEAGATVHEIKAILGHTTLQMAEKYTRGVDRRRLATSGMAKLTAAGKKDGKA